MIELFIMNIWKASNEYEKEKKKKKKWTWWSIVRIKQQFYLSIIKQLIQVYCS